MKKTITNSISTPINKVLIGLIILFILLASYFIYANIKSTSMVKELSSELEQKQAELVLKEVSLAEKEVVIQNTKSFFDTYIKATTKWELANSNDNAGDFYFDLAKDYYSDPNAPWSYTIESCKIAREYFSTAAGEYNNAEALYKKAKEKAPDYYWTSLTTQFSLLMNSASIIVWNKFESCEYLESTAQSYYNGDITGANWALAESNKKIAAHDKEVLVYNDILAEINAILETKE